MPDMEKVIKGLQEVIDCENIVYLYRAEAIECAIEMLKAQEPMKPVPSDRYVRTEPVTFDYKCVVCNAGLVRHWVCCPCCGQAVKWE